MKNNCFWISIVTVFSLLSPVFPAMAAELLVTVTNTTNGTYFTPLLITAHPDSQQLFDLGQPATSELQAMAEGGDISGLEALVGGSDVDTIANPANGLLGPGSSTTASLNTDQSGNTRLSLAAMLLPTNDGFVGLDAIEIPSAPGTYIYYLNAYDAGTEANDERVVGEPGGASGTPGIPADPGGRAGSYGQGVTASEDNPTVHIHRGILGDTNPEGGFSDLDSTQHRWLNPVAKLVLEIL